MDETLRWVSLDSPLEILQTFDLDEVRPLLRRVEAAAGDGKLAAGYVAYEAAPAFDSALVVHQPKALPLLWFGIFDRSEILEQLPEPSIEGLAELDWRPSLSAAEHRRGIEAVHRCIARGDTYQVNYTFQLVSPFDAPAWRLFLALCQGQPSRFGTFVDTGERVLCSASPELFFRLEGERIWSRPMKGTAPRGRSADEDEQQARWLLGSAKNRAENVMIVDMVRNDLGRIASPETVEVSQLWQLEKYPSLYQLTSTVEARTQAPLEEIFRALFPCASVTGAPKIRAMEIIHELEPHPRGAYTGAIGLVGPGRRARFSVGIRTVEVDPATRQAIYGTGSGVVWDSVAAEEWQECRTKTRILRPPSPAFDLLETVLWDPEKGFWLLDGHLRRLAASARYFDFPLDPDRWRREIEDREPADSRQPLRIRVLLHRDGGLSVEPSALDSSSRPWRLAVASTPVSEMDPFLFHKTTHRQIYDRHRAAFPNHDDVLLWNRRGEVTESTMANVVIRRDGRWITPPVDCGLLAGAYRALLLERDEIEEAVIGLDQLSECDDIRLINSVRGCIAVELDTTTLTRKTETRPSESA